MCIIVDPPLFVPMFKPSNPDHLTYKSVLDWVHLGPGKFVIGGSQYKKELRAVATVLPILAEYERRGKVVRRSDGLVDAEVAQVQLIEPNPDFDDPHLVALVRVSGCKLICVNDPRSHRYLRRHDFYVSSKKRLSLYTNKKNERLLTKNKIAPCCR